MPPPFPEIKRESAKLFVANAPRSQVVFKSLVVPLRVISHRNVR